MTSDAEQFQTLKKRLPDIWTALSSDPTYKHTSVIVPSLSVNQEELSKVTGAAYYEERLLFALIRLRNPNARLIYVTSQPVHPDIVEYYLDMLEGVPTQHARQRLHVLSVCDASARPLTEKVLERPRFVQRMRELVGDTKHAYLTCYNSTPLERRLAVALELPLNGLDPSLLGHGTKSGNRRVFAEAGVRYPAGSEDLHSEDEIVDALLELGQQRPAVKKAVVKLNEGFGGEGNSIFEYPPERGDRGALREALHKLAWTSSTETTQSFLRKFGVMGGIVEEMVTASETRSPSVQMRVSPQGQPSLVSSHEQLLGGSTGQSYLGCRFPADDAYRELLQQEAAKIGRVLGEKGVVGRFGVDFLVGREAGGDWTANAIEINLRMGGTTPPFHALEFLTGGKLDTKNGLFICPDGQLKYYNATDNLKSATYRGLLPEDLFEIVARHGLGYRTSTGTGALFHMIGALSQYGKIGMTCIANNPAEAQQLFERTVEILDNETDSSGHGVQAPLLDRHFAME
ncbi:MAG: ATP-grasp domain-containing protein [Gammaproteobacteria bacterium]|nr:ATP-grasp domain-containing protein [Gammaproteobacteria bacterium]